MTLFIYEHLTSGALSGEPYSASLMHEGDAMLQAITSDLVALGYNIALMRDARLDNDAFNQDQVKQFEVNSFDEYQIVWQQAVNTYQQFLIIAPETDGILASLIETLEQHDKTVLGSDAATIRLCSDKLATYQHLQQHGLSTPATQLATEWLTSDPQPDAFWIIKPRDGAGCENTYLLDTSQAQAMLAQMIKQRHQASLVQSYIKGQNLSLSLFVDEGGIELLSVNIQHIDVADQQLTLHHCEPMRLDQLDDKQALTLAQSIHATMPALWGFVGIDLIKTSDTIWIIEINPRLTSSYADTAMRQKQNPANRLHQSLQHKLPEPL